MIFRLDFASGNKMHVSAPRQDLLRFYVMQDLPEIQDFEKELIISERLEFKKRAPITLFYMDNYLS